jgi:hypothetical protein
MYNLFAPVFANHLRGSLATNSGTLSDRRCSGTPFSTITSASAEMTLDEDQRRSARNHQALAGLLIDRVEDAHASSIARLYANEVIAPHMLRTLWPKPRT